MKKLIAVVVLTLISIPAWAYVIGPSNFDFGGYPEPRCIEPNPPYSNDEYSWSLFKSEIAEYEACVDEYVKAAENDIEVIRDQANQAVRKYNAFINALQSGW